MDDDYILAKQQIIKAMNENNLILFVGAGISVNSGLPSWKELISSLRAELQLNEEESTAKDYLRIAQYYYDTFGQNQYINKIEDIFSNGEMSTPNELHNLIEKVSPKHIITTNYDNLLEQQFNKGILKYDVVAEDKDIPYTNSEHYLIKMHGDLKKKNWVLKEDDYLDYQLNFPMLSTLIKSLIMNHSLLFVGYSLEDSTFNSIFRLIQNSFSYDAKVAYFYTTSKPSQIIRDYYRKKGIYIISNEDSCLGEDAKKLNEDSRYYLTKQFFNDILQDKIENINNDNKLWEQLSFLDKLNFIDVKDLYRYSRLTGRAYQKNDEYLWLNDSEGNFKIENDSLISFVKKKTLLSQFFNVEFGDKRDINTNDFLKEAYALYKDKKYVLAKVKFRELANLAYQRKDYFSYLICEFNFNHIHDYFDQINYEEDSQSDEKFQPPIVTTKLDKMTQDLFDSVTGNDKKLIEYFKDNILNMHFLYRKLEDINDLFDKIRDENQTYKNGGISYNNDLFNADFTIRNLQQFLNSNCICVDQYKIYKSIINRYLEILLLSYDNAYSKSDTPQLFGGPTSSTLKEIDLDDIKIILPNIDKKKIEFYLKNYSLSKIKVSEEAKTFIFERFQELSALNFSRLSDNLNEYKRILSLLSIIDLQKLDRLILVLKDIDFNYTVSSEVKSLLKTIIESSQLLSSQNKIELKNIIISQIIKIEESNDSLYYPLFPLYKELLDLCSIEKRTTISFEKLSIQLLKIKGNQLDSNSIFEFQPFLIYFFKYLEQDCQNEIIEIFSNITPEDDILKIYNDVIELMYGEIFDFPDLREVIYNILIEKVNNKNANKSVEIFPDPWKKSLSHLYDLDNKGYFQDKDILSELQVDISGVFPEIDWVWLHNYSDEIIEKLLEKRTIENTKKFFAKTEQEQLILDKYLKKYLSSK